MRDGYTWVDLRELRGEEFVLEEYIDGEILLRRSLTAKLNVDRQLIIVTHDGLGFVAYTPQEET